MAAQSICFEHHVYGLENETESLFFGKKTSCETFFRLWENFSCVLGVYLVVGWCIFFNLPFALFFVPPRKKTLTFRHGSNRWQFFIHSTVARHFRRQIMTEISFITVIFCITCFIEGIPRNLLQSEEIKRKTQRLESDTKWHSWILHKCFPFFVSRENARIIRNGIVDSQVRALALFVLLYHL